MKIATAKQMRELDRITIEERGVPSTELMERAAAALARAAGEAAGKRPAGGPSASAARATMGATAWPRPGSCWRRAGRSGPFWWGRRYRMTPDCQEMAERLEKKGGKLEDFTASDPDFAAWCLGADVMIRRPLRHRAEYRAAGGRADCGTYDEYLRHPGGLRRYSPAGWRRTRAASWARR